MFHARHRNPLLFVAEFTFVFAFGNIRRHRLHFGQNLPNVVRGFQRSVVAELGLDRRPELWADYFGHYRRVVWLAQSRSADLEAAAADVAAMFGLPLTVIDTGTEGLERELERLVAEGGG